MGEGEGKEGQNGRWTGGRTLIEGEGGEGKDGRLRGWKREG